MIDENQALASAPCGDGGPVQARREPDFSRWRFSTVVFDLDDTLHDWRGSWERARAVVAETLGRKAGIEPEAVLAAFQVAEARHLPEWDARRLWAVDTEVSYYRQVWTTALARLGLDPNPAAALAEQQLAARLDRLTLFPDALATLEALRGHGVRLGLITNGPRDAQRAEAERLGLIPHFDALLVEGELGFGKPDERIYAALAAQLPGPYLMVGDDLQNDVVGPKRAGWTGYWLNRNGRVNRPDLLPPDRVIRDLWGIWP